MKQARVVQDGITFDVSFSINGGAGFYSDPAADEIELESICVEDTDINIIEVLAVGVVDSIYESVRELYIDGDL